MTTTTAEERTSWLREAAASGEVHTVRLAWSDRLGAWRGKRLPVERFLDGPESRMGFCDGMIVVDVNCDVIEGTPFSNFNTGYPDMYLRPRAETIRPVGWVPGEAFVLGTLESHEGVPLEVAPARVLDGVLARLADSGVAVTARLTLSGRLMNSPTEGVLLLPDGTAQDRSRGDVLRPAVEGLTRSGVPVDFVTADRDGSFRLGLGPLPGAEAASSSVITKAALKEVAVLAGRQATFMTRLPGTERCSHLRVDLRLEGIESLDPGSVAARVAAVRALLQPSMNAVKAGPPPVSVAGDRIVVEASSEADPFTATAAILAAAGAAGAAVDGAARADAVTRTLDAATDALESCSWAAEWLGSPFIENAVPLLRHESGLFDSVVTDWETDRYWSAS